MNKRYIHFIDRRFDTYPDDGSGYPTYSIKLSSCDDSNENFHICIDNDKDEQKLLQLSDWIKRNHSYSKISFQKQKQLRNMPSGGVHYK